MKRLLFVSLILIVSLVVFAQAQKSYEAKVSVYFSPEGKCQDAIIEEIDSAKSSIYVAMYYFTNGDLAEALVKAKKKGVTIKVLLDKGQKEYKHAKGNLLKDNDILVLYYSPPNGIMHNKFAVIDKFIIITGSFNWTGKDEECNNEDLLIIQSSDIAKEYIEVWNSLWEKGIK